MKFLALDIGGANLKAADGLGYAASTFFPLWKQPPDLPAALGSMIDAAPPSDCLAVTMTGELADCYRTKREGVRSILAAVAVAAGDRAVQVYCTDGRFQSLDAAGEQPLLAAASNWHALARFAGRFAPTGVALLVDIGSTTSDLVPLRDGKVIARGSTDPERLALGELVYTGIERSPLCAIIREIPWRGQSCAVAQELFATSRDAYLMLGELPEDSADCNTADDRPATRDCAWDRLARSICADRELFGESDALTAAGAVRDTQLTMLVAAVTHVVEYAGIPGTIILSGHGEFLGRRLVELLPISPQIVSLNDLLGPAVSRAGPAHAVAILAREAMDIVR